MTDQTDDLIRRRAFELSLDPSRAGMGALDNWLEAERSFRGGLEEGATPYEAAAAEASPPSITPAIASGRANTAKAAGARKLRRAS